MTETPSNRLKDLRIAAGLRPEELAVEFRVSKETIERWERGEIPAKWIRPLAARFSVSISHLLRDDMEVAA